MLEKYLIFYNFAMIETNVNNFDENLSKIGILILNLRITTSNPEKIMPVSRD
jgi:hypothetical protein